MPFELQPTLRGELLTLSPLRAEDFDAVHAAANDPLIWEQHPSSDRYMDGPFRIFFDESLKSGGALVARDNRDGRVIGSSRFHNHDEGKREIEIGWSFLVRSHWGGRYNGEMKQLMLRHAFRFVDRVIFLIGPTNHRSQRAIEKIGGRRVGARVDDTTGREVVVYEIGARPP